MRSLYWLWWLVHNEIGFLSPTRAGFRSRSIRFVKSPAFREEGLRQVRYIACLGISSARILARYTLGCHETCQLKISSRNLWLEFEFGYCFFLKKNLLSSLQIPLTQKHMSNFAKLQFIVLKYSGHSMCLWLVLVQHLWQLSRLAWEHKNVNATYLLFILEGIKIA